MKYYKLQLWYLIQNYNLNFTLKLSSATYSFVQYIIYCPICLIKRIISYMNEMSVGIQNYIKYKDKTCSEDIMHSNIDFCKYWPSRKKVY